MYALDYPSRQDIDSMRIFKIRLTSGAKTFCSSFYILTATRMIVTVSDHPIIDQKMTQLRDQTTSSPDFRRLIKEITFYLGYEATRTLKTHEKNVTTPMAAKAKGKVISDTICIIPILRAGLTMSESLMDLLPEAAVHHIGMYRVPGSSMPVQYYNRLPREHDTDVAFITDPSHR